MPKKREPNTTENPTENTKSLSHILDSLNTTHGAGTIRYAATGIDKPWRMRSNYRSPCYTTRWSDLPLIPTFY